MQHAYLARFLGVLLFSERCEKYRFLCEIFHILDHGQYFGGQTMSWGYHFVPFTLTRSHSPYPLNLQSQKSGPCLSENFNFVSFLEEDHV